MTKVAVSLGPEKIESLSWQVTWSDPKTQVVCKCLSSFNWRSVVAPMFGCRFVPNLKRSQPNQNPNDPPNHTMSDHVNWSHATISPPMMLKEQQKTRVPHLKDKHSQVVVNTWPASPGSPLRVAGWIFFCARPSSTVSCPWSQEWPLPGPWKKNSMSRSLEASWWPKKQSNDFPRKMAGWFLGWDMNGGEFSGCGGGKIS